MLPLCLENAFEPFFVLVVSSRVVYFLDFAPPHALAKNHTYEKRDEIEK